VPVIIWLNGGFGAGKTTLAKELHRRVPDAVVYNPEDVGLMLWKWMPPNDDFQHPAELAGTGRRDGAAAARQPGGTLMLRSDRLTAAELADEVLAAAVAFDAWLA
jgi:hypothetical protein